MNQNPYMDHNPNLSREDREALKDMEQQEPRWPKLRSGLISFLLPSLVAALLAFLFQSVIVGVVGMWIAFASVWLYRRHQRGELHLSLPRRQKQQPLPPLPTREP
jgi:hypothetical protein